MTIAIIVFVDIVGFTQKSVVRQLSLVKAMAAEVRGAIGDLLTSTDAQPGAVVLPTGDGMAVALVETHARGDEVLRRALSLAARLFLFAQQQSSEPPPVQIRVGLHCGEIQYLTDINDRPNVCGGAINHAQRVMDAANDGQCLISEDIQIKYLDRLDVYSFPIRGEQDGSAAFSGPLDVMVKHGRRATVRVAALKYEGRLISAPLDLAPVSKSQSVVTFTDLPKNIIVNDGFGSKLTKAKSICLIQLTGENLIRKPSLTR